MKKRVVIIMAAILLIAVIGVVVFICNEYVDESHEKSERQTEKNEVNDETKEEDSIIEYETNGDIEAEMETEDCSDIVTDVEAVFAAALDYIVEDEELTAKEKVSNAILKKTEITVNSANETVCNVTVKYPDAAKLLKEEEASLPKEAAEEDIDEMMEGLAKSIESENVEMVEKTIDVELVEKDGIWNIKWTSELYDAVTGGLYSIE